MTSSVAVPEMYFFLARNRAPRLDKMSDFHGFFLSHVGMHLGCFESS